MIQTGAFDEQKSTKNVFSIETTGAQIWLGGLRLKATELDLAILVCFDYPFDSSVAEMADAVVDHHARLKESGVCDRR